MVTDMAAQRLDKLISGQRIISRADAKKLITGGHIMVNGVLCRIPDTKVDPDTEEITADGEPLCYKKHLYLMLNKPAGVVSAARDARVKTVLDLVPEPLRRKGLFPAGRLDKDTVGFVLITDDGDFAHRLLSPGRHVPKTYHALLSELPDEPALERLREGIELADGSVCRPARVSILSASPPVAELVITEGMYHQVKRMFAAAGNRVLQLKRVKIGALWLDDSLPEGMCKEILNKDVEKLLVRDL